jgi:replicative DNA helicase
MSEIKKSVAKKGQVFSLQAEQAIVAALLLAPADTFITVADKLSPEKFYDTFCRAVFEKSFELLSAGGIADTVVLSAVLEGVVPLEQNEIQDKLAAICREHPVSSNVEAWSEVISRKAAERALATAGQRMLDMAYVQDISPEAKLSESVSLLNEASNLSVQKRTGISTAEMVAATVAMVEENSLKGDGVSGLSTGIDDLDKLTAGLQNGDLIIVAGRPAMGKTSFALTVAHAIAGNVDYEMRRYVQLFSLEMGKTQIGMRWIAVDKDVPIANMRSGKVTPEQWERMREAVVDAGEQKFQLEEEANITIEEIAAAARKMKKEKGLSLLVVDYLQLISSRSSENRTNQISEISRGLKNLAMELKIPVIALSQLSRNLEQRADKRPIMSDLRESGAIEQDADIIIFVYRDVVYHPDSAEADLAEIIIAKQRNGPLGTVKVKFDGPTTRFYQMHQKIKNGPGEGYREVIPSSA